VPPNLGLKILLNYLKHDFNFKDISVFILRLHTISRDGISKTTRLGLSN